MTPSECPTCGEQLIHLHLHQGFVHCRNAHVVLLAPIQDIDPGTLITFANTAIDHATVAGLRVYIDRVERWRTLMHTELKEPK